MPAAPAFKKLQEAFKVYILNYFFRIDKILTGADSS